jgi:hypothetical protein
MSATFEPTPLFQFMTVRSPQTVEDKAIRQFFIKDEVVLNRARNTRSVFAKESNSSIGQLLFNRIICDNSGLDISAKNKALVNDVLELLDHTTLSCDETTGITDAAILNDFEQRPFIFHDNKYYFLNTMIEHISGEFDRHKLIKTRKLIEKHTNNYNRKVLLDELRALYDVDLLTELIYNGDGGYDFSYQQIRNVLFDNLYILYILRRITSINLENIIAGLQTLHTLEVLAMEDLLDSIRDGSVNADDAAIQDVIDFLKSTHPDLNQIDFKDAALLHVCISDAHTLLRYFQSTPIIHPLVARLHWYNKPFNKIRPIGIGDLKVLKQSLLGYKVGEISHIHNIMKGETKDRTHRKLEKTEESSNFFNEDTSDKQTENETTNRFEIKKETESVIKTDINVGVNANLTYKNDLVGITATVGGNFAYNNSRQDAEKTASNYARDIMEKAVTNIQNRSSRSRTITRIFETEEINKHSFTNTGQTATHVSGIYRWLDKKYSAQLYNYGKRMMFEFVIPEPAAFYVMSKLKAVEFDINAPVKPAVPQYQPVDVRIPGNEIHTLYPNSISEANFNNLRQKYDLQEFTYPKETKKITFRHLDGKSLLQNDVGGNSDGKVLTDSYSMVIEDKGYRINTFRLEGVMKFWGINEPEDNHQNVHGIIINGFSSAATNNSGNEINSILHQNLDLGVNSIDIADGKINVDLYFQDVHWYTLTLILGLTIDPAFKLDWQTSVYNKIMSIEQKKIDKINQDAEIAYQSQLSDYYSKLNELNTQTVNDIIQGRSEEFNKQIIKEELKKHCLTMIAKEFDADSTDDILSGLDAMEDKTVAIKYEKFFAGEVPKASPSSSMNNQGEMETVIQFMETEKDARYPKINLETAKIKSRYIQFLEQAFEWENIAYIFYPYFWAKENKWVKLMNRLDYTDNNMTAFLKAGSVRVLIAVTPAYNDAVMHFLETREPWEGGQLPVIGDPLFIPIYEEIRKQQDDMLNAVAEGKPWEFELPTSLVYLQDSATPIPTDLIQS